MASREELQILQQQRKESKAYLDELLAGKTAEERMNVKKGKAYKDELAKLREINEQVKEIQANNKIVVDDLIRQEASLKSMTGIQSHLGKLDRKRIDMQAGISSELTVQHENLNTAADLIQDISKLSTEDSIAQERKLEQLDGIISKMREEGLVGEDIIENLKAQRDEAKAISSLSDKQQKFLSKQLEVYDGIKDTIGGVLETASLLTSTVGGVLGGALIGAGVAGKALLSTMKELGGSIGTTNTIATTLFSKVFPDAVGTVKGLSSEFGGLADVSLKTQFRTNVLAKNLGISAGEAASLTGSFARLNDGSAETAQNLIESTKNLAQANGLVPNQIMADVANSAEEFALFGKDGGKNIAEAAIAAGKLGVSMSKISGVADNLLDFESSINAELELGAMLGKNINLDRARALAYEGDIGGSVRETLSALGGIEEFNKMDYFQKKQTAALLGVSVSEFQKMAENADKLDKNGELTLSTYDNLTNTAKAFGSQIMSGVQGLGSMAVAAGQMGFNLKGGLKSMKGMGGLTEKIKGLFGKDALSKARKNLSDKQIAAGFGGKKAKDALSGKAAKMAPDTSVSDNLNKTAGSKGPKASNLLKGAAAILILAAALFVAAKAFQEFGSVTWPAVGMGLASLVGLAAIAYVLGKAQGEMIKGAIAVAILGAALIPFAFSMSLIAGLDIGSVMAAAAGLVIFSAAIFGLGALMMTGVGAFIFGAGLAALAGLGVSMMVLGAGLLVAAAGFQAIGGSMGSVVSLISQVKDVLGGMFQYIAPIAALALGLVGLAGALTLVGVAGIAALPGLMAVAAIGTIAMGVGSLLGIGGDEGGAGGDSDLITEIRGLREDLNSGKVAVYLDGQKVTSGVSKVVSRVGSNSYAT
jgi:hypothetical protein